MSEEELRKIAKEYAEMYFIKGIDSTKIFKYVDELEKKVEQQEKENKELKEENKRIFQNVNDDELLISNAMNYAELKKTEKKVEQLENIRKEAIEEIQRVLDIWTNKPNEIATLDLEYLLNILNKGDNNGK